MMQDGQTAQQPAKEGNMTKLEEEFKALLEKLSKQKMSEMVNSDLMQLADLADSIRENCHVESEENWQSSNCYEEWDNSGCSF